MEVAHSVHYRRAQRPDRPEPSGLQRVQRQNSKPPPHLRSFGEHDRPRRMQREGSG